VIGGGNYFGIPEPRPGPLLTGGFCETPYGDIIVELFVLLLSDYKFPGVIGEPLSVIEDDPYDPDDPEIPFTRKRIFRR
jgi:hypothetical protein